MDARIVRTLFLCVLFALGQAGAVVAQGAVTASPYTTVTGQSLAWSAPWTFVEDDAMQTADLDLVFLTDGAATVALSTGGINPENARGLVIGFLGGDTNSFEVLDKGGGAASAYWFDAFPIDDEPFGAFSTATALDAVNSVLLMYIAPVASFGEGLASAQQGITLDGTPLFDGVDAMALQAQLGAAVPTPDTSGFKPKDRWVDENYGVSVEWADGWISLGTRDANTFMLGSAATMAQVHITAMDRNGATPDDWAWQFGQVPEELAPEGLEVEPYIGQSNVIAVFFDGDMMVVQEVLFLDDGDTVVLVTIGGVAPLMPPAINALRANVRIDGRTLLDGWETIAPALEIYSGQ